MIETVDRFKLAKQLNNHLQEMNKELDILVQVNIAGDKNKSGIVPDETQNLLTDLQALAHLRVRGLMTIPPYSDNPEETRPHFRNLRLLGQNLAAKELFFDNKRVELSMGMTNDYRVAIEEGATLIRIGTAIFGQRDISSI
ncbi:unnamed protein product [Cyprideis torosa]|uniref:Uncharacterized protein n=1 Tax=Cyprideis torosa TaxID=163714 RepID=A0A7R8WWT3_9CRUS|nr:unnamed protein product [Cyprideis torosa]CAG0911908.1 unnamed protein product [Cyprideis torosa]